MRHLVMISAALSSLALGFAMSGATAAPLLGSTTSANAAPSSVEPVFFFRCGLFGQRCRYNRDSRRFERR